MGFAPLDSVNVPVGRMIVKLYPKIIALMPVHEREHAFQVNKLALKDLPTNLWLVIDAFGAQLNASLTVEGILSKWRHFFQEHWMNFGHLSILSFHNSQGARMDNTTTAANAQVLLPIQNGPLAGCCKQDVRFVQVQCTLDFAPLIMVDPYPVSSTLRVLYYIKLPQSSQGMMNGSGVAYNLNSYLGLADLQTLMPEVVRTTILNQCSRMAQSCWKRPTLTSRTQIPTLQESGWRLTGRSSSLCGTNCVPQFSSSCALVTPTNLKQCSSTSSSPTSMQMATMSVSLCFLIIKG